MTGNVALDVSIGLVFIYLLFSLYATVLMELVASTLGLRARNLTYALKRMLMDEKKYSNGFADSLSRAWTTIIQMWGKSSNLTNQKLYNNFFNQPTIKYLNNGGISSKPSYISPQMFVKALIDTIKVDDPGISLAASIEQGLIQLDNDMAKEFKAKGQDVDVDKPLSETVGHIESLMRDANGDIVKFKILLENWYEETMSRASGWYKRTVQIVLLLLGLCISFSFNVDTKAIVKKLSNDPDAREQMVKLAISYVEEHRDGQDSVMASNEDSIDKDERRKYLEATKKELAKEIGNSQHLLASGWHIKKRYLTYDISRKDKLDPDSIECNWKLNGNYVYATVHTSINKDYFEANYKPSNGIINVTPFWFKVGYVWSHPGGYFLTILAISLGAPFWFDILNKLVKLRTSKAIVEESNKDTTAGRSGTKSDILNRAG